MSRPRPDACRKHQHPGDGDGMLEMYSRNGGSPSGRSARSSTPRNRGRAARLGRGAWARRPWRALVRLRRVHRKDPCADGSQRWLCKGCGRTFSAKSRAAGRLEARRLDLGAFVRSTLAGRSLRSAPGTAHVCLRTSGSCARLCEVMARSVLPFQDGALGLWQVDGTYLDESLAGEQVQERGRDAEAPQARRRRPRQRHLSLRSPVVCGASDARGRVLPPGGRGGPRTRRW